jgi:hypothetical protein
MNDIKKPIVIISAERIENTAMENFNASRKLEAWIKREGWDYGNAIGKYKNYKENSFIIEMHPNNEDEVLSKLVDMATTFSQENFLYLNEKRTAYLIDPITRGLDIIGKMERVEAEEAHANSGFVYLPEAKEYFIIR